MVEFRARHDPAGERLPWLEPVEDEDDDAPGGGLGRTALVVIALIVAAVLVAGAVVWVRARQGGQTDVGQILRAPPGPYKVRPAQPGGLQVEGAGEVAYGTSEGQDVDAAIDLGALPETPMAGPGAEPETPMAGPGAEPAPEPASAPTAPRPQVATAPASSPAVPKPAAAPAAMPTAPATASPPAAPATGSGTVQLGAFSSQAKANAAWKSLAGRFAALKDMTQSVTSVEAASGTLYRLRATGAPSAARLCAQLKVAGETCTVIP